MKFAAAITLFLAPAALAFAPQQQAFRPQSQLFSTAEKVRTSKSVDVYRCENVQEISNACPNLYI